MKIKLFSISLFLLLAFGNLANGGEFPDLTGYWHGNATILDETGVVISHVGMQITEQQMQCFKGVIIIPPPLGDGTQVKVVGGIISNEIRFSSEDTIFGGQFRLSPNGYMDGFWHNMGGTLSPKQTAVFHLKLDVQNKYVNP